MFNTWIVAVDTANPAISNALQANGLKGWAGWPSDPEIEALRDQWLRRSGLEAQQRIAAEVQERTLADLMDALDSAVQLAECNDPAPEECCSFARHCPIRAPIAQVHNRIRAVLETVRLVTTGLNRTEYAIFDSGKETSSGFLR